MNTIDDGGPAFPLTALVPEYQHGEKTGNFKPNSIPGMTLRDYFAAKAMASMLRNVTDRDGFSSCDWNDERARLAYLQADAMLKARRA